MKFILMFWMFGLLFSGNVYANPNKAKEIEGVLDSLLSAFKNRSLQNFCEETQEFEEDSTEEETLVFDPPVIDVWEETTEIPETLFPLPPEETKEPKLPDLPKPKPREPEECTLDSCEEGYVLNKDECKCICQKECKNNFVLNEDTCSCICNSDTSELVNVSGEEVCCLLCESGKIRQENTCDCICEEQTCDTNQGKVFDDEACQCVCDTGFTEFENTPGNKECCANENVLLNDGQVQYCCPKCDENYVETVEQQECSCICDPKLTCSDNQILNESCECECDTGYEMVSGSNTCCTECPEYQIVSLDESGNCQCVCEEQTCSENEELNEQCSCECVEGRTKNELGVCVCDSNKQENDQNQCVCKDKCLKNYDQMPDTCECVCSLTSDSCKSGWIFNQNKCKCECASCALDENGIPYCPEPNS